MMKKGDHLGNSSNLLVLLGAINWGLIAAFDWDLVGTLVGSMPTVERVVYILIGLSALYIVFEGHGGGKRKK
ncbi:MAG TPA: DUF378 domain-containing protein [Patescibacteria group bacterium]|nr:DUF378 domain-containing protein [Patescibacteria group bacterium]